MDAKTLLDLMYEQTEDHALVLLDENGAVVAWMMGATNIFGRTAVELQHGTVQVRSEGIGRGSELTVHLPLARRTAS